MKVSTIYILWLCLLLLTISFKEDTIRINIISSRKAFIGIQRDCFLALHHYMTLQVV